MICIIEFIFETKYDFFNAIIFILQIVLYTEIIISFIKINT